MTEGPALQLPSWEFWREPTEWREPYLEMEKEQVMSTLSLLL